MQATIRRDSSFHNVMQSNTAKILKEMNYEEVESYLLSYFIISFDERKDLANKPSRDQKMYIINKVIKGTEETFCSFLKALEESEDESNHNLMTHLQHDHQAKGRITPWCESEMLNTFSSSSMQDELVFGESPLTLTSSKTSHSSLYSLHSGTLNQSKMEPERARSIASSEDHSWTMVYPYANITYSKNLTLVMEYICVKIMDSLTETNSVKPIFTDLRNISLSIKLPKKVYLAADPETVTDVTRAADDQIRQSYKLLIKALQKLQSTNHNIHINLNQILQTINYSSDKITLSECNIESLIQAVDNLNQASRATTHKHCVII